MKNLQKNFEKNGYVIVPGNKKLLDDLRKIIFHNIKKNKKIKLPRLYGEDFEKLFNNFHKLIKLKNLNNLRFNIYNNINSNSIFSNIFYNIAKEYLDELVGNEISMQKKINLALKLLNPK